MLDQRLGLVYDLYHPCALAADIGTDHGLLPCALLESGKCERMILTDISEKALTNAVNEASKRGLTDRISFRCGNGLLPVTEKCGVISITGMGGRTIAGILTGGYDHLAGCDLILSAHTDLPEVRQAVADIGYHLTHEEVCMAAGRFYLVFKAVPGNAAASERDIRLGSLLFASASPYLIPYIERRISVLNEKLKGLERHSVKDEEDEIRAQIVSDIGFYRERIRERT